MKWVTRKNARVDRIACPWLIRRFVDPDAEFLYVPVEEVAAVAGARSAIPYDVRRPLRLVQQQVAEGRWPVTPVPAAVYEET